MIIGIMHEAGPQKVSNEIISADTQASCDTKKQFYTFGGGSYCRGFVKNPEFAIIIRNKVEQRNVSSAMQKSS